MKFNTDVYTAEFLQHFLAIIQSQEKVNSAVLGSGFLRASVLNKTIAPISTDRSFIPLSAAQLAGLIDASGNILTDEHNEIVQRLEFSFDAQRTTGLLVSLGFPNMHYSMAQQLVLAATIQEAEHLTLLGSFRIFYANTQSMSNEELRERILNFQKNLALLALNDLAIQLQFRPNSYTLTDHSVAIVQEKYRILVITSTYPSEDIPDGELINDELPEEKPTAIDHKERVPLVNEIIATLSQKTPITNHEEYVAKIKVLRLLADIYSSTLHDKWGVTAQLVRCGGCLSIEGRNTTLPATIYQIMQIIHEAMLPEQTTTYLQTLRRIQTISKHYASLGGYTWIRNFFPVVAASKEAIAFHQQVLAIRMPSLEKSEEAIQSPLSALTSILFSASFAADDEEDSGDKSNDLYSNENGPGPF
jgi:hypothetical protein